MKILFKRLLCLSLLFMTFTLTLSLNQPVEAVTYTSVQVKTTEGLRVSPGGEFTTTISMGSFIDVVGFQLGFVYDSSLFTLVDIEKNPALQGELTYNINVPGELRVSYSYVETTINAPTDLFDVTFVASNNIGLNTYTLFGVDQGFTQMVSWADAFNEIRSVDDISFNLPPIEAGIYGDVNGDSVVNIIDAGYIQQYMVGIRTFDFGQMQLADVNLDGEVDAIDVAYIQQYIVGLRAYLGYEGTIPSDYIYPTGYFDYSEADFNLRLNFMAAAEKYLLDTMSGGIPVYTNGHYMIYSDRMALPYDHYIPVIDYSDQYGTFTEDDSTIMMADGMVGNPGEYTFRTSLVGDVYSWNPYLTDTTTQEELMEIYMDQPYIFHYNDTQNGFEIIPSMMASDPIAMNPSYDDQGLRSNIWRFEVKDNLEWYYHPDTDVSNITDDVIDANDFVETYKLALAENWFRAVSGGNDFYSTFSGIVGVEAFNDNPTEENWANVGIRLIDDLTFEIEFNDDCSLWDIKYFMASVMKSPVHVEMYQLLGNDFYTSPTTMAYNGPYYVEEYIDDSLIELKANPNLIDPNYTGYEIHLVGSNEDQMNLYEQGYLDKAPIPIDQVGTYINQPNVYDIPGVTNFRMMINGLGDVASQQEQFPGSNYVPEPLLANLDFKKAMYFATNRLEISQQLNVEPYGMYYFTDQYLVDAELGIPYRMTEAGMSVGEDYSAETYGYDETRAYQYFKEAVSKLVNDGVYQPGDTITIDLFVMSNNDMLTTLGQSIKNSFESIFTYPEYNIHVEVNVTEKDFPGIYYDHMMTGDFDLAIGGISGSTLDASSLLDIFCDDNRIGFTLNWGIDTTSANIPVEYDTYEYDAFGQIIQTIHHQEMWSYNAITTVLNEGVMVENGEEVARPAVEFLEILPTEFTFRIDQFENENLVNFRYSIFEYGQNGEGYYVFDGLEDIPMMSDVVTITNTLPYPYDYEVIIYYDYAGVEDMTSIQVFDWSYSGELINQVDVYDTYAVFGLETSDQPSRIFVEGSIEVYDMDGVPIDGAVYTINGRTVEISGLEPNTEYFMRYYTSDLFTDSFVTDHMRVDFMTSDGGNEENMVYNPEFGSNDGWNLFVYNGDASFDGTSGDAIISVSQVGTDSWDPRLDSSEMFFYKWNVYEVSFDARADMARSIQVMIGHLYDTDPYFEDFLNGQNTIFDLSTNWDHYTFTFTMENESDFGQILFELGLIEGGVGTDGLLTDVYLDNISIVPIHSVLPLPTQVNTISEGLALEYGSFVEFLGMTVIAVDSYGGIYFTDGADILFIYNPPFEVFVGEVYDFKGQTTLYYNQPQLAPSEDYPLIANISTEPPQSPDVITGQSVSDIVGSLIPPTVENPFEYQMYEVTAKVYYNPDWGNRGVFLVPVDYDESVPLPEGALKPNGDALMIYYRSNMDILQAFAGQVVTVQIMTHSYRVNEEVFAVSYYGGYEGVISNITDDQQAIDIVLSALSFPQMANDGETLYVPTEMFGVSLSWSSSNDTLINPMTGYVDLSSLESYEDVMLTVIATRGTMTDSRSFNIGVGDILISGILDVINGTLGYSYRIQGIVTFITREGFYITDGVGSLFVYMGGYDYSIINIEDEIQLEGELGEYGDVLQLINVDINQIEWMSYGNGVSYDPIIYIPGVTELIPGEIYTITATIRMEGSYNDLYLYDGDTKIGVIRYTSLDESVEALQMYVGEIVTIDVMYARTTTEASFYINFGYDDIIHEIMTDNIVVDNLDPLEIGDSVLAAWVWKSSEETGGVWVEGTYVDDHFSFLLPEGYDAFLLATFASGTTDFDWAIAIDQTNDCMIPSFGLFDGSTMVWRVVD